MNLWQRIKARLAVARLTPVGTVGIPVGQHEELTEASKYRREHGFSMATSPLEASPEIAAHNAAISREYEAEIDRRKALHAAGEYTPRYYVPVISEGPEGTVIYEITTEVDWDLEMTMLPGRRTDVTKDTLQALPLAKAEDVDKAREVNRLRTGIADIEGGRVHVTKQTGRDVVGSRETILEACGGNASMADQVEANALKMLGLASLDDVIVL